MMRDRGGSTRTGTVGWIFGKSADAAKAVARLRQAGFADVRLSERTGWTSRQHVPEQEGHTALDFATSLQAGGFDAGDSRAFTDAVASGATLLTLDAGARAGEALGVLRGETVVHKTLAPFDPAAPPSTTAASPSATPPSPALQPQPPPAEPSASQPGPSEATPVGLSSYEPMTMQPPPAPYSAPEAPTVGSLIPDETAPGYRAQPNADEVAESTVPPRATDESTAPDSSATPRRRGIIRTDT